MQLQRTAMEWRSNVNIVMMFAGLITVAIFGCIGQSYAVKVATQSQESREVFTLDELYESLHALKCDSNITQTHLKDIEGLLKAAGRLSVVEIDIDYRDSFSL